MLEIIVNDLETEEKLTARYDECVVIGITTGEAGQKREEIFLASTRKAAEAIADCPYTRAAARLGVAIYDAKRDSEEVEKERKYKNFMEGLEKMVKSMEDD